MPCVPWCNLSQVPGPGWAKIHESFSFQREDVASCGRHFLALGPMGFKSAEHADKVMSQIINYCDYCNYCDYFYYFRLESIMASLRAYGWLNATPSPKRFVSWVQDTVRFCVMAGFTTSRRKMLLADRGRVLGGSKPLSEWRLLCMMKRRFCCDMPSGKAAITKMCHCSMRRLLEMKQTNQLAAGSEIE